MCTSGLNYLFLFKRFRIVEFSDLDLTKTYSYADYLKWIFEERLELIKGRIFRMSPAPGSVLQRLSLRLGRWIGNYLEGKRCEVFTAPFDVRLHAFPLKINRYLR